MRIQVPNIFFKACGQRIALVVFLLVSSVNGQVLINEFSASNSTQIEDTDFEKYSDWIELYNAGTNAQNIKGYFLTDDFKEPEKWRISSDLTIEAGGFLLVWADGNDIENHTNFKLSADGEEIALYNSNAALLDSISFGVQTVDVSMGRTVDANANWSFFETATPKASNSTTSYESFVYHVPEFSIRGGFYTSSQDVELTTDFGGEIRYTTDGSKPLMTSEKYNTPIPITNTTIVRSRIFMSNFLPGPTVTHTYFINENSVDAKIPVVSIATEPSNFWDPNTGIYVQDFKPLWEVPINIELFENKGGDRAAFNERAGCKVNGLWSWQLPQKMLGVYFKKQHGTNKLEYPLMTQRKRSSYKSFSLRASGSDWSYTLFRDMLGHQSTVLNMDLDIMAFKPSLVYVNGEYMGIHNIREKVNDDYIEKSYHLDSGSFDLVENEDFAESGDLQAYNDLLVLLNKELSDEANFDAVANVMDIENFTDYVIAEMAVANTSINHNVMAWKPKQTGKWRWILMDVDRGFFKPNDHLIDFYSEQTVWPFSKLLNNAGYKAYFGKRLADQLYTSYNPDRMMMLIDKQKQAIESELPKHVERWEGRTSSYGDALSSVDDWSNAVSALVAVKDSSNVSINRSVFYNNKDAVACYEKNLGSAGGNAIVTNSILSNSSNKPLFVDAKSTLQSAYCLTDFATDTSYPLNLQGNPKFTNPTFFDFHLQPNSLALNAGMENETAIDLGTVFPQPSFEPNVMISQIFTNLENSDIPEFLTLYNPSNETADLSGYAFTKGISAVIPEGLFLEGKEELFLTKDASAIIWEKENIQVVEWQSGKLSNTGESLELQDRFGITIDHLKYQEDGSWPESAFNGQYVLQIKSDALDNHFGESWTAVKIDEAFCI